MTTVYKICLEILIVIADILDSKYIDLDVAYKKLLEFLTSKNPEIDKLMIDNFKGFLPADVNYLKKTMMLIIASKVYLLNNYNVIRNINAEESTSTLETLDEMSMQDIIRTFINHDPFAIELIEEFFCFKDESYIKQNQCKSLFFTNGGDLKQLIRINPFETLDVTDYIPDDKFTTTELIIQMFFDIYEKALEYTAKDDYGEAENYNNEDEFLSSIFIEFLKQTLRDNESEITIFLSYVFSNIYETLCSNQTPSDLIEELKDSSAIELVNKFLNEADFAIEIIDTFVDCNDFLADGDLLTRRDQFKKKGNIQVLKRLNPYFQEEEIIFQHTKEASEI